ncbi:MAG: MetS family NSS transporter small subunit [Candidatus Marinimicrobia bacterium]|nr:MetS family NSS transporter small subunit [Candidatus Neomarinimicrobiota bacterium]
MEIGTIVMMVLLLGFVWGGFAFSIKLAIKKNKEKKEIEV